MPALADESTFWLHVAVICSFVVAGFVTFVTLWFFFINFIANEMHHPLDWYSNKLRTRPCWYFLLVVFFTGVILAVLFTGQLDLFHATVPELACGVYLQGILIGVVTFWSESAGASLTAMCVYAVVGALLVLVVLIPTFPARHPGMIYSTLYLAANIIVVVWLGAGIGRHLGRDGKPRLLPQGAEMVFKHWSWAVKRWTPALALVLNLVDLTHDLLDTGEYGKAMAVCYYVIAMVLLAGCCHSYQADTAMPAQ